jgi:hypothetical protein
MPIPGTTPAQTVPETMHEWKNGGGIHSGKGGPLVPRTPEGQRQALAIGYSYARRNKEKQDAKK